MERPSPSLNLDSKISNAITINEDTLSGEPTVFVRSMSHESTGAKDLDEYLENSLEKAGHRLVNRSSGATIKIVAELIYAGPAEGLHADNVLMSGYGSAVNKDETPNQQNQEYHSVAILDVKVTMMNIENADEQVCRIFVGARLPMPKMGDSEIRKALLSKAADQVKVFFEY